MQLGQLQKIEKDLLELGFQIVALSPDKPEKLRASVKKNQLNYRLLSDSQMQASQALGLAFQMPPDVLKVYKEHGIDLEEASGENHHLLPVPAVFLVGTDGIIQYQYANPDYKVRLDPEVLVAAARAQQKRPGKSQ